MWGQHAAPFLGRAVTIQHITHSVNWDFLYVLLNVESDAGAGLLLSPEVWM